MITVNTGRAFPTRSFFHVLFVLGLLLGGFSLDVASAQEKKVPLNRDSTLYTIDPELREELDLFPEVSAFRAAALYRSPEEGYELVIQYRDGDRTRRTRRSLTEQEVADLRERVSNALEDRGTSSASLGDGRFELIASTTFHGFVQGGLVTAATGAYKDYRNVVAIPLLGSAAGFFGPFFATRNGRVTDSEAYMTFYGTSQGYLHGLELAGLTAGTDLLKHYRITSAMMAGGGAVEGTAGYLVARRNNWTGGHAEMVSFTGLGFNFVGFGTARTILVESGFRDRAVIRDNFSMDSAVRLTSGMSLMGSIVGIYLGHRMGRTGRYTKGDARVYLLSANQSFALVNSILSVSGIDSPRLSSALSTGALVGGGLLGRRLVQNRDFTRGQSFFLWGGSRAGGALGATAALITESSAALITESSITESSIKRYNALASVGSALGFGITYALLQNDAQEQASKTLSSVDVDVNVSPSGTLVSSPERGTMSIAERVTPRVTFTMEF